MKLDVDMNTVSIELVSDTLYNKIALPDLTPGDNPVGAVFAGAVIPGAETFLQNHSLTYSCCQQCL